ncbi:MAG: TIM barrel protein [Rhodobacteraceae bacterium]|nr:TIM barrel protein [Paracoccaceae bacterium]
MTRPNRPRYACRLNAFRTPGGGIAEMLAGAARVGGIDAADLNFPDHFAGTTPAALRALLDGHGMAPNGLAMRYYTEPGFRLGAFTHPDRAVRRAAIDLTRRGIDAAAEIGAPLMTIWLGQDGVDYSFQGDFGRMWEDAVAALAEVAAHDPAIDISVEYKPNEPRAHALLPDAATTLLAIREAGAPNLGVTIDFAHMLYAGEVPAHAARLIARSSRLLGVHLNDGYGKRDDGLIAGAVHPVQTLELFVELARIGWDGVIYFDTFPDHGGLDPVAEARASIALVERLRTVAADLAADPVLAEATARQDAAAATRRVAAALYGAHGGAGGLTGGGAGER